MSTLNLRFHVSVFQCFSGSIFSSYLRDLRVLRGKIFLNFFSAISAISVVKFFDSIFLSSLLPSSHSYNQPGQYPLPPVPVVSIPIFHLFLPCVIPAHAGIHLNFIIFLMSGKCHSLALIVIPAQAGIQYSSCPSCSSWLNLLLPIAFFRFLSSLSPSQ